MCEVTTMLRDLDPEERTALVALVEYMVEANGNVTDEEAERIDSIVQAFGADVYRTTVQEVTDRFPDELSLRAFLTTISREQARETIYGTTLSVAVCDAMRPEERDLLFWLAQEWGIRTIFETPEGARLNLQDAELAYDDTDPASKE
jgi:uncharacterized membrane protein YebE (DUF533 family)